MLPPSSTAVVVVVTAATIPFLPSDQIWGGEGEDGWVAIAAFFCCCCCRRAATTIALLPSAQIWGGEGEEGRAATRSRGGEGVQGTVVVTTFFCCHRCHHRCPPPLRPDLGELKERRGESPSPRCRRRRALSELPNPVAPWSRCRDRGSLLQPPSLLLRVEMPPSPCHFSSKPPPLLSTPHPSANRIDAWDNVSRGFIGVNGWWRRR